MTLRRMKKGLPNGMIPFKGMIHVEDLRITNSRLKAKLLVFKNPTALKAFWRTVLKSPLPKGVTLGAVNALSCSYSLPGQSPNRIEVDPRFFCLIGLCQKHLSMEIISHESVHAGYAFALRRTKTPWAKHSYDMPEEAVAYPAGRIAAAINRVLHRENLYLP